MALPGRLAERGGNGAALRGMGLALADLGSLSLSRESVLSKSLSDLPSLYEPESLRSLKLSDLMRNGAEFIGERGRGEMKLPFGMGADDGGEIRCLAAETGVLARGGWSELCGQAEWRGVLLILEYAESTLLGLNTPLVDLIVAEEGC